MIGLLSAAALLLIAAGLAKLLRPGTESALVTGRIPLADRLSGPALTRATGLVELLVAVLAIAIGGRAEAALIAVSYAALAGMSIRLLSIPRSTVGRGPDCGCFGRPSVLTHWHTATNLGYLAIGLVAMLRPPASLATELAQHPVTGMALLLAAALLSYLSYLLMTALPELLRSAVPLEVAR